MVKIHSDEIKLLIPAGHPLAGRETVAARELVGTPLLIPKSGTTRARLNAWLEPVEDEISISMELDSTEMIKQFVIAGLGVSFLAASHCREEQSQGRLFTASLAPEPMIRRVGLIYRRDKSLSKASLGFIETIIEHAGCRIQQGRTPTESGSGVVMAQHVEMLDGSGSSTGNRLRVYRSVEEVPPEIRRRFSERSDGLRTATILIADRNGRERLLRARRRESADVASRASCRRGSCRTRSGHRTALGGGRGPVRFRRRHVGALRAAIDVDCYRGCFALR